jgi:hypothetical protein
MAYGMRKKGKHPLSTDEAQPVPAGPAVVESPAGATVQEPVAVEKPTHTPPAPGLSGGTPHVELEESTARDLPSAWEPSELLGGDVVIDVAPNFRYLWFVALYALCMAVLFGLDKYSQSGWFITESAKQCTNYTGTTILLAVALVPGLLTYLFSPRYGYGVGLLCAIGSCLYLDDIPDSLALGYCFDPTIWRRVSAVSGWLGVVTEVQVRAEYDWLSLILASAVFSTILGVWLDYVSRLRNQPIVLKDHHTEITNLAMRRNVDPDLLAHVIYAAEGRARDANLVLTLKTTAQSWCKSHRGDWPAGFSVSQCLIAVREAMAFSSAADTAGAYWSLDPIARGLRVSNALAKGAYGGYQCIGGS